MTKSKPAMLLFAFMLVFTMFTGARMEVDAAVTNCVGNNHHLVARCGSVMGEDYSSCSYWGCGHSGGTHPSSCKRTTHTVKYQTISTPAKCYYCSYSTNVSPHSATVGHVSLCDGSNYHGSHQ